MALQDSLTSASISLTRAQSTLSYIFDSLVGPGPVSGESAADTASGITGEAQRLACRLEQLESQLNGLRDALVTPTPVSPAHSSASFASALNGVDRSY